MRFKAINQIRNHTNSNPIHSVLTQPRIVDEVSCFAEVVREIARDQQNVQRNQEGQAEENVADVQEKLGHLMEFTK